MSQCSWVCCWLCRQVKTGVSKRSCIEKDILPESKGALTVTEHQIIHAMPLCTTNTSIWATGPAFLGWRGACEWINSMRLFYLMAKKTLITPFRGLNKALVANAHNLMQNDTIETVCSYRAWQLSCSWVSGAKERQAKRDTAPNFTYAIKTVVPGCKDLVDCQLQSGKQNNKLVD